MASRIIHLAITNELSQQYEFSNIDRLYFGTIIPDGVSSCQDYILSHFKLRISDTGKRSYNLTEYKEKFGNLLKVDDLYLGYYLHLIQDLLYRHFMYDRYHWNPKPDGNIERLHDDYKQINAYVISKYGLHSDIHVPNGFASEKINEIADFEPDRFIQELKNDFERIEYKERFFFTDNMVDEYIQWAVEYCKKELAALENGSYYFDEYEWSWG
ncbi:MAG: hypothetical protein ACLS55_10635 [Lachnospiraceae bacterium]